LKRPFCRREEKGRGVGEEKGREEKEDRDRVNTCIR